LKLIRLLVAVMALSMVFGASAASANVTGADASGATVSAKPNFVRQAKQKCRATKGRAKQRCIRRKSVQLRKRYQAKVRRAKARARAKAKRERLAEQRNPKVTIRTTEYGIPRIVADTYRGLGFGYGFALAKENICSMAQIYTTVRGERSKYFGPNGSWQLTGNGISYTNLEADFAHKRVIAEDTIGKVLRKGGINAPNPQVQEVVRGYVKGYNKYLSLTGIDNIPDTTCAGQPWVKPITVLDTYLRFYELGTMAGLGAAVDGTANAAPPLTVLSARKAQAQADSITTEDLEAIDEKRPDIGSNAVSLGSEATTTGKGMLFGNPHFPWSGSERFFQAQLTVPGKMNVSGASLLGAPVVLIGHTQNLAWSHTVSTARRFSAFREELVPGEPTKYIVDGQQKSMKTTEVTVEVKQPDDSIEPETRTLYSTVHGPVFTTVQKSPAFPWTTQYAYTMFDPNSQGLRFINHFFDADRSQSVDDLKNALVKNQGVPWVNTIAADSKGNALYADIGAIPNIDQARVNECGTPGLGAGAWGTLQVAVLDGTRPECDMQKAPGAVATGILPPDKLPILIRKDYASNMNDSYWLANPEQPLTGFSPIIGNENFPRSLRTRNGLVQIEQQLANGGKFDLARVQEFITNNRNYGAELWVDPLVSYCQANPTINSVDVSAACAVLANYGKTEGLDDAGALLWRRVMGKLQAVTGGSGAFLNSYSSADPVHTPNGLDTSKVAVQNALPAAVTEMSNLGIPLDASYRDYQTVTRNGIEIPIPGGFGGQGVFNVISATDGNADGKYDNVRHGSSFIISASLTGAKCPDVKTILTYSQAATNESSPHYTDQTELFSNGEWVTDRFCASQQKQSPDLQVTNLNGGSKAARRGW
jgi:acyl-homoserine-lactone acylase